MHFQNFLLTSVRWRLTSTGWLLKSWFTKSKHSCKNSFANITMLHYEVKRDYKSWTIPYYNKWDGSNDEGKKLINCILILELMETQQQRLSDISITHTCTCTVADFALFSDVFKVTRFETCTVSSVGRAIYGRQLKFSNMNLEQYLDGRPHCADLGIYLIRYLHVIWLTEICVHLSDMQGGSFVIQYLQSRILWKAVLLARI